MKWLFLFALLWCPVFFANAQDIHAILKEAEKLEAIPDEAAALHKFREVLKYQPLNIVALNKCAELCCRIGKRQASPAAVDDYYHAAKTYIGIALKVNPNNSESNCIMAMVLGRSSMAKTGREKIENAREIKKYVDLSLKNDPRNFLAWHILGRWHYELNNLNFVERSAVKVLYGGLPHASIKESIKAFEIARTIAPGFLLNYFEMAKAYRHDGQQAMARAYLEKMLLLPNITEDDPTIKEMARSQLKTWN